MSSRVCSSAAFAIAAAAAAVAAACEAVPAAAAAFAIAAVAAAAAGGCCGCCTGRGMVKARADLRADAEPSVRAYGCIGPPWSTPVFPK